MIQIYRVQNRRDLRQFIRLPYHLYRDDPLWVPPLRLEQWKQFDREKNPMLAHCTVQLFLLKDGVEVIGRCAAFIDHLAVDYWGAPIGLFGSFECADDGAAAHLLLEAAQGWLRERGMKTMRGPWSFASQEWGLEIEGGERPPVILAPHNPPYYPVHFDSFGLKKAIDLLAYLADMNAGYQVPERYLTLTEKIRSRYNVTVRAVDLDNLEQEVMTIVEVSNCSIADNWGYRPVTMEEARAMARDLKPIVNPQALLIAEDVGGNPIGFGISLPDVNRILHGMNGRILPFGWLKLLLGLKKLRHYRMWALGVVPEYQGRAIDTLLYQAIYDALKDIRVCMEINYVLEDNHRMINALVKMGVTPIRRYRVYEMAID